MLPIHNRLKKREDFSTVFSKGFFAGSANIAIKYAGNSLPASRIGFPVGKNYSKKAVARNRARRVLRAATAILLPNLKPGYDIVVLIKPSYQNIGLEKTAIELKKIFQKANLLT